MKKICIVYYLGNVPPYSDQQADVIKNAYSADVILLLEANNQLDGLQYPYITIDEAEDAETDE